MTFKAEAETYYDEIADDAQEQHRSQERFKKKELDSQSTLINHLSEYPLYAEDSEIANLLNQRLEAICGDNYTKPQLYVRSSSEPNACIIGKSLVVDSGLLEVLDSHEEIDGILGHEITHHQENHGHDQNKRDALSRLGIIRAHEVEADVKGMFRQNDRGSNPRGLISALEKIAEYQEQHEDYKGGDLHRLMELPKKEPLI